MVPDGPGPPTPGPAEFRVVEVVDLAMELPSQFPLVSLRETDAPHRVLVIPIGLPEGVALAQARGKVATPRPVTHELMASILVSFTIDVVAVRLTGRRSGTYLAELVLSGLRGRETVPCRASDGLILTHRLTVPAPVLVDRRLIETEGDVEPVPSA